MAATASPPLVSVILTAYNRPRHLPAAIESILNQRFTDYELLIADDASTDPKPRQIAEQYAAGNPRIRTLNLSENGGVANARNCGIDNARGTYIALQDDDDVSHPLRLEKQVRFMQRHRSLAAVTGGTYLCGQDLEPHCLMQVAKPLMLPVRPEQNRYAFSSGNTSALIRRDCLLKVGKFRTWFRTASDWDMAFRLQDHYPVAAIPDPATYYREHHSAGQLTDSPLLWHYHCAGILCSHYRRTGRDEPIGDGIDPQSLVPLFAELPEAEKERVGQVALHYLKQALEAGKYDRALALYRELATLCDEAALTGMTAAIKPMALAPGLDPQAPAALKELVRLIAARPAASGTMQAVSCAFRGWQLRDIIRAGNYEQALDAYRTMAEEFEAQTLAEGVTAAICELYLQDGPASPARSELMRRMRTLPLSAAYLPEDALLTGRQLKTMMRAGQFSRISGLLTLYKDLADTSGYRRALGRLRRKAIKYSLLYFKPGYWLS